MITLQRQKQEDVETKKKRKKRRRGFDDIIEKLERKSLPIKLASFIATAKSK